MKKIILLILLLLNISIKFISGTVILDFGTSVYSQSFGEEQEQHVHDLCSREAENGVAEIGPCWVIYTSITTNYCCECYEHLGQDPPVDWIEVTPGCTTTPDVDCNGDPGGTAEWAACGCIGGNTGIPKCPEEEPEEPVNYDCNGDENGTAYLDACGTCVGGNTGKTSKTYYRDSDEDGWGNSSITISCFEGGNKWTTQGGDYNDNCYNTANSPTQCSPLCTSNNTIPITWNPFSYTTDWSAGPSTTTAAPFVIEYEACADITNQVWRLRVKKITGGVVVIIRTGGYRDAVLMPPTTQWEAQDALDALEGYYSTGSAQAWHTLNASVEHERYHYREWKCMTENYWTQTENCLEQFTIPLSSQADAAGAKNALIALGANTKIDDFVQAAQDYWATLSDGPSSRPYAAGQAELDNVILSILATATVNGWSVIGNPVSASSATPCYQPFSSLTLTPCP